MVVNTNDDLINGGHVQLIELKHPYAWYTIQWQIENRVSELMPLESELVETWGVHIRITNGPKFVDLESKLCSCPDRGGLCVQPLSFKRQWLNMQIIPSIWLHIYPKLFPRMVHYRHCVLWRTRYTKFIQHLLFNISLLTDAGKRLPEDHSVFFNESHKNTVSMMISIDLPNDLTHNDQILNSVRLMMEYERTLLSKASPIDSQVVLQASSTYI